jgi:hypothetical protein
MTWTVTKEEGDRNATPGFGPKLHVRAIIDIDNEQADLKDLIASLQKHVRADPS